MTQSLSMNIYVDHAPETALQDVVYQYIFQQRCVDLDR